MVTLIASVDWQPIIDAVAKLIIAISIPLSAFFAQRASAHAKAANRAVNSVPKGEPSILDRTIGLEESVARIEKKLKNPDQKPD